MALLTLGEWENSWPGEQTQPIVGSPGGRDQWVGDMSGHIFWDWGFVTQGLLQLS